MDASTTLLRRSLPCSFLKTLNWARFTLTRDGEMNYSHPSLEFFWPDFRKFLDENRTLFQNEAPSPRWQNASDWARARTDHAGELRVPSTRVHGTLR